VNRKNPTNAEGLLWSRLRNRRPVGLKFRRQHPLGPFILDFFCVEKRLAVELHGAGHARTIVADAARSEWLERRGIRVIRFTNQQILKDLDAVLETIADAANSSPLP
jgi:very-short-patch-repair endonuclease